MSTISYIGEQGQVCCNVKCYPFANAVHTHSPSPGAFHVHRQGTRGGMSLLERTKEVDALIRTQ